jgi:hypothetical protein
MEIQNGYYWVNPAKGPYKGKWVIATFENGLFLIHGTGETYTDEDMLEIDTFLIIRETPFHKVPSWLSAEAVSVARRYYQNGETLAAINHLVTISKNYVENPIKWATFFANEYFNK